MKSVLLVYKTKTGFTKKYVDWITETITCQTILFDQINNVDINNYDIIIYGAGMHAGRIQGLKEFKNKAISNSYDHSSSEYIKPMIAYLHALVVETKWLNSILTM